MTVREFLFFVVDKHVDLETEVSVDQAFGVYSLNLPDTYEEGAELVLLGEDPEDDE